MAELRIVNMEEYQLMSERYQLVSDSRVGAPLCPYGNHFEWIGYDRHENEYIRFTKSVFKMLVNSMKSIN